LVADGLSDVALVSADPVTVVLQRAGVRHRFTVTRDGTDLYVDSPLGPVGLCVVDPFPDPEDLVAEGSLLAPTPGSIVRVAVVEGDIVSAGQAIMWLEAMKMQQQISAPHAGTVTAVPVRPGQQVDVGAVLVVIETATEASE